MAIAVKAQKPVTIKEVAKLAGTSTTTVSYVLNNEKRYIRPELRERVLKAAADTGYVKNAAASSIKGKQRKVLAVVVAQFANSFFTRMCVDIVAKAREEGYVVMLCNSDEDPQQEKEILERLIAQRIDGCILSPALSLGENISALKRQHSPYVIFERTVEGPFTDHNFVGHDNFQSAQLATETLLEAGHRQIAFLGWDSPIPNVCERVDGYRAALRAYGVDPRPEWVATGELSEEAGRLLAEKLAGAGVTAMVFAHHTLAKGALLYFQEKQIRWPQDFSLVVIGTPEWAGVLLPKITCIERPEREMAAAAAAMLLRSIKNPEHEPEQQIFPSLVILGQSIQKRSA